jgi:transcription initiation factor TFIIB
MTDRISDEIDGILSDVLEDIEPSTIDTTTDNITFAQSIAPDKRLGEISKYTDRLAETLEVPTATVDLAKSLAEQYRTQRGDLVGTSLELVAASCLYCGVKVTEQPLDPTDFADADEAIMSRLALLRRSKDIASTVGLDPSAFFGSEQYIDRYCTELMTSQAVKERAHKILELTEDAGLSSGKSPSGWAAAAVYNAALDVGEKLTQHEVSDVSNTSEVTIRNRYKEQRDYLRSAESLPDDPLDVIDFVADACEIAEPTAELAKVLIRNARGTLHPVDDEAILWGLSALRRAGELTEGSIQLKTLSQYTPDSSDKIKSRSKKLRSISNQVELHTFRGDQDTEESASPGS